MKFKDKNLGYRLQLFKIFILLLQLPPSYEQVIKEINQVQVNTTNNNNFKTRAAFQLSETQLPGTIKNSKED